jgi:hypothetical protein
MNLFYFYSQGSDIGKVHILSQVPYMYYINTDQSAMQNHNECTWKISALHTGSHMHSHLFLQLMLKDILNHS